MKQFVEDNDLLSVRNPTEFSEEFSLFAQHPTSGSLTETVSPSSFERFSSCQDKSSIILPSHYTKALFNTQEVEGSRKLHSIIYSVPLSSVEVNKAFRKYKHLSMFDKCIGSYSSVSKSTSTVMVFWNGDLFSSNSSDRPARINYFILCTVLQSRMKFLLICFSLHLGISIVQMEITLVDL